MHTLSLSSLPPEQNNRCSHNVLNAWMGWNRLFNSLTLHCHIIIIIVIMIITLAIMHVHMGVQHPSAGAANGRRQSARWQHSPPWGPPSRTGYTWYGLHTLTLRLDPQHHVSRYSTFCGGYQFAGSGVPGTQWSEPCDQTLLGALLWPMYCDVCELQALLDFDFILV